MSTGMLQFALQVFGPALILVVITVVVNASILSKLPLDDDD